jgi:hypothetical protein
MDVRHTLMFIDEDEEGERRINIEREIYCRLR